VLINETSENGHQHILKGTISGKLPSGEPLGTVNFYVEVYAETPKGRPMHVIFTSPDDDTIYKHATIYTERLDWVIADLFMEFRHQFGIPPVMFSANYIGIYL